ncbi:MAG: lysine--tRNA ligase [Planctomycetota bacterium]|nr:lysine--tRNA ligase [Planctomycetota bacterium]
MTHRVSPDRLKKLAALREKGTAPYPARVSDKPDPIDKLTSDVDGQTDSTFTIAGRLGQVRDFGKLRFAHLTDRSGRLQVAFERDQLADWWPDRKLVEQGDIVSIQGLLGRTKKGEPTLWARTVTLLTKALRDPPEKFHGLVDVEARYRMRYVDLFTNDDVRRQFQVRSAIIREIRSYLDELGFLEVETPILHSIPGGALARPFVTHHNALDMQLYMRIAPELYLKRLLVGGLERVYELGRVFRNEGVSTRHNPEFTMLETYEAFADYEVVMERVEGLFDRLCAKVLGTHKVRFRDVEYDLAPPFPKKCYLDLFAEHNGGLDFFDVDKVTARAKELGVHKPELPPEKIGNDVFEETVEPHLDGPVFVIDYPKAISPFAKPSDADPRLAERFELFVSQMELCNAFSELNDPIDQEERLKEQVIYKDDETPAEVDYDYVSALEYGMPPAGGLGIGIDRLVMLLTGKPSIRDVLLFPLLRRAHGDDALAPPATEEPEPQAT